MSPEQQIARAKEIATAMTLAQVGDVDAMANEQTLTLLDEIEDDWQMVYALMRVFTGTTIHLVRGLLEEMGVEVTHERTMQLLRVAIDDVTMTPRPLDE